MAEAAPIAEVIETKTPHTPPAAAKEEVKQPEAKTKEGEAPPAKEPTLDERRRELKEIARQEQAKLHARRQERADVERARAELKAATERSTALEQELKEWREWRELSTKDKIAAAKRLGIDTKELAEDIVRSGTPDEKISALEKQLSDLTEKNAKVREDYERRVKQAEFEQARERAKQALIETYTKGKEKLPVLAKIAKDNPDRLVREYMRTWREAEEDSELQRSAQEAGMDIRQYLSSQFTDEQFLEATDARLKSLSEELTEAAKPANSTVEATNGSGRQGTQAATGTGKTLTNAHASEKATVDTDEEFEIRKGETLEQADRRQNAIIARRLGIAKT